MRYTRRLGLDMSESQLLHNLAKMYLQAWRGRGNKSATARRYNIEIEEHRYRRVSWYVSKVLYSALWKRGIHSGESISRMLDFAIRQYSKRLVEELLSNPYERNPRAQRAYPYWAARAEQRRRKRPWPFVTYACVTEENSATGLRYRQESRILTKTELFALTTPLWPLPQG